jgi:hypothetical protein
MAIRQARSGGPRLRWPASRGKIPSGPRPQADQWERKDLRAEAGKDRARAPGTAARCAWNRRYRRTSMPRGRATPDLRDHVDPKAIADQPATAEPAAPVG